MNKEPRSAGNFRHFSLFLWMAVVGATLALCVFGLPRDSFSQGAGSGRQLPGFGIYRVVRIDADGIAPKVVHIQTGSTIVWYNAIEKYASVVFNEGERLNRSTQSPTLFFLAPDGTYVSAAFGPGATASTAFVRKGTYHYFVTGLPVSERAAFGRVVVE